MCGFRSKSVIDDEGFNGRDSLSVLEKHGISESDIP